MVSGPYGSGIWCPAGAPCAPLADGDGFAVGDTVLSLYYDQSAGTVEFSATDAAGNRPPRPSTWARAVVQLRAPRRRLGHLTAPAAATKLYAFSGAALTTYSGSHSSLSSWFSHSKVIGTFTPRWFALFGGSSDQLKSLASVIRSNERLGLADFSLRDAEDS